MEMEENKPCPNRSPIGTDGTAMFFVGEDILIKGKVSDTCICTVFSIFLLAEGNCLLFVSKRGLFPPQLAKMQVSLIDAHTCMNLYKQFYWYIDNGKQIWYSEIELLNIEINFDF